MPVADHILCSPSTVVPSLRILQGNCGLIQPICLPQQPVFLEDTLAAHAAKNKKVPARSLDTAKSVEPQKLQRICRARALAHALHQSAVYGRYTLHHTALKADGQGLKTLHRFCFFLC